MKLNQEWQKQWDNIAVPEEAISQLIDEHLAAHQKVSIITRTKRKLQAVRQRIHFKKRYLLIAGIVMVISGALVLGSQRQQNELLSATDTVADYNPSQNETHFSETLTNDEATVRAESTDLGNEDKMVQFYDFIKETVDFSVDVAKLETLIRESNSYIETASLGKWYGDLQSAYYRLRIPTENSQETLEKLREIGQTTEENVQTENYTTQYTDNESRITALATEETALLEMLAKSEQLEDMLKIQERLSSIRAQRETLTRTNNSIDNQVAYITVELTLKEMSQVEQKQESSSILTRISGNLEQQKLFWQTQVEDAVVWLGSNSFYLILVALGLFLGWRKFKKSMNKKVS